VLVHGLAASYQAAVPPTEGGVEQTGQAIDGEPVWSITCVYVARSHRRRHLSAKLIAASVGYVRAQGGHIVESYPVPVKPGVTSTNYAFTGFVSAFEEAGFTECMRRSETRPIMRYRTAPPSRCVKRPANR
jgi:GNAT superfamily N-acetyltransferase